MQNKVVVTGMGVVTPIGIGLPEFWNNLIKGTDGVRKISSFNTDAFRTDKGAEVHGFDDIASPGKSFGECGRASRFAIKASIEAFNQAGIDRDLMKSARIAICVGTTMGEMQVLEEGVASSFKGKGINPELPGLYPCNVISKNLANFFGISGMLVTIPSACSAGNFAIGYAHDLIRSGRADIVLTGGTDPMSQIAFAGFNKLMACSPDVCSPFDADRKGMIVGEGAGFLVLESLSSAEERKASVHAEISGYGLSNDAFKSTIPHPEGKGGIESIGKALKNSSLDISDIDYICAHGTGTVENDRVETLISKTVFGKRSYEIPMSSLKSMLGHTMGACGAIETIACIKMINEGIIVPTINYKTPDPACDLDYVPNAARKAKIRNALNNSYAFGGNNASLIISEYRN
jgi:3-oxoacyl-[acyl-carrier-protein] synthase II